MFPEESAIHHFPKNMLHCFVDDFRRLGSQDDGILFKAELFSISPLKNNFAGKGAVDQSWRFLRSSPQFQNGFGG